MHLRLSDRAKTKLVTEHDKTFGNKGIIRTVFITRTKVSHV